VTNCIDPPSQIDFGEFACDDALGVMLAHTLTVGFRKLKKGHALDGDDIAALKTAGIHSVSGARLRSDDVAEDAAAAAVATLLAGPNTEERRAYTGRCNLHATTNGLLVIDAEVIVRVNRIDESITVGTLPPWSLVRKGQVIATVKIIPYGVNLHVIEACRTMLGSLAAPPLRVADLPSQRVALIFSELPGLTESAIATTRAATRQRIEALGSRLVLELRCQHNTSAVEFALRQAHAAGCELIMVCGAAGTKDRRDTIGAAIVAAGGRIERFGMPVEPGNMLLLGRLDEVPLIVLPGCARSRRLNGLDWVLRRLLARQPLNDEDFAAMSIGGLIRTTTEPAEEEIDIPCPSLPASGPRIAALVLAAGRSSRMGEANKLLESLDGVPLVLRAVNAALASRAASVTVVTGHAAESVAALVGGPRVAIAHNPDHAEGMASSLRHGIAALPADTDGVLVLLGDMPLISAAHLDALIEVFSDDKIIVPVHAGRRGNPLLWPRRHFAEMQALTGDQGARGLLEKYADHIHAMEFSDPAIFMDVDTPQDLSDCIVEKRGGKHE
jgi:molybdenum cofactor cytidylyltransferase